MLDDDQPDRPLAQYIYCKGIGRPLACPVRNNNELSFLEARMPVHEAVIQLRYNSIFNSLYMTQHGV
jgi:hypothetical protein